MRNGLIVVLPEFRNRARIIREILDQAIPAYLPGLVERPERPPETERPTWLTDFPLTQAEKLSQEVSDLGAEIQRLEGERAAKDRQRADLHRCQNLLRGG